jgi:hypothetical protein
MAHLCAGHVSASNWSVNKCKQNNMILDCVTNRDTIKDVSRMKCKPVCQCISYLNSIKSSSANILPYVLEIGVRAQVYTPEELAPISRSKKPRSQNEETPAAQTHTGNYDYQTTRTIQWDQYRCAMCQHLKLASNKKTGDTIDTPSK